jgi:hypothetical protein
MFWSCLRTRGCDSLYKIEQALNVMHYLELLQNELFTTLVNFNFDLD